MKPYLMSSGPFAGSYVVDTGVFKQTIAALEAITRMHCTQDGHYRDNAGAMDQARAALANLTK